MLFIPRIFQQLIYPPSNGLKNIIYDKDKSPTCLGTGIPAYGNLTPGCLNMEEINIFDTLKFILRTFVA
jgi:hypothetical protein